MAVLLSTGSGMTNIAGVVQSISFASGTCKSIDTSAMNALISTYVMGKREGASVNMVVLCEAKPTLPASGVTSTAFTLTFGSGQSAFTFSFNGFLTSCNVTAGKDEPISATLEILISGAIT